MICGSKLYIHTQKSHTRSTYRIPRIQVEPEGFQLELKFILLAPLHEVRLGSCQLSIT